MGSPKKSVWTFSAIGSKIIVSDRIRTRTTLGHLWQIEFHCLSTIVLNLQEYAITKGDGTEFLGSHICRSLIEKTVKNQKIDKFLKWQSLRILKIPLMSILGDFWWFHSDRRKIRHNKIVKIAFKWFYAIFALLLCRCLRQML